MAPEVISSPIDMISAIMRRGAVEARRASLEAVKSLEGEIVFSLVMWGLEEGVKLGMNVARRRKLTGERRRKNNDAVSNALSANELCWDASCGRLNDVRNRKDARRRDAS